MSTLHRLRAARRTHVPRHYPYDPAHPTAPYGQIQREVGAAMLMGAIVIAVLMVLIGIGLA